LAAPALAVAYLFRATAEERLSEQVVASHVRSLLVSRPTDIPSSNQHQVKPWFRGRVNFAPQVPDLAADGFVLAGGRMDYLTDRPAAAIVYYRREHPINVFTWPAEDDGERPVRALHRQGFHIRWWQNAGMVYWVISDLNPQELDEFVRLFQSHAVVSP
jgi:anti-sigma factor RsiW